ncbi:RNA polymerase sigma factor [Paenibacillus ginsengarvi]|uniref:RNA polymerase sigma factor n=1 Tax=Paenibacillus ginsengarvi TaxID=400777 RepID=A0A3B0CNG7_9BACL|nr:RNA polymerase sigma factor [Paenibacillus ginsengarvi]RKN86024.1 RNA polymerase sigma factor [Paenibacillus ginsengarvi]
MKQLQQKINRYSLKITSNDRECEDLAQDVLLKVHKRMEADPACEISNAYLYKIVLNTWKDKLKKRSLPSEPLDERHLGLPGIDTELSARELLELLAHRLPPRAMVIVLLMDVFDFTAKETAGLLSLAEGAVQVAVGRARLKLKKLAKQPDSASPASYQPDGSEQLDFESLVEAFRRRNPDAICKSYLSLAKQQIKLSQLSYRDGQLVFYFEDPDGNLIRVTS